MSENKRAVASSSSKTSKKRSRPGDEEDAPREYAVVHKEPAMVIQIDKTHSPRDIDRILRDAIFDMTIDHHRKNRFRDRARRSEFSRSKLRKWINDPKKCNLLFVSPSSRSSPVNWISTISNIAFSEYVDVRNITMEAISVAKAHIAGPDTSDYASMVVFLYFSTQEYTRYVFLGVSTAGILKNSSSIFSDLRKTIQFDVDVLHAPDKTRAYKPWLTHTFSREKWGQSNEKVRVNGGRSEIYSVVPVERLLNKYA
jgi:hypothetical protein